MTAALASQHTASLPALLSRLGASLLVSTYNAGQLILLRAQPDGLLNTHFCALAKPMGFALDHEKLAVGSAFQIWEYRNMQAVAPKVKGPAAHDAAYLARNIHVTGDIDIHEMAYGADDQLWLVNTRMSCLCTLDRAHSIVPRWRPPFVSAYDLSDRCHLNGLALRDGQPAAVTALGDTDAPGGWRARKADGGVLLSVPDGEPLAAGLSMPHSPRWHQGRLWFLESGKGSLAYLDDAGAVRTVAELPGFTRGLAFAGRYAFVGLSQVRETSVFAGLPLTRRVAERHCGVWVVDTETGETVAYATFTGEVREIFAVGVVPARFPVILDIGDPLMRTSYALPEEALAEVAPPDPVQVELEAATVAQIAGRLEEAVQGYQKLLIQRPDHVQARFQMGVALNDLERWEQAREAMEWVVAVQPEHAEALNGIGLALCGTRRFEDAIGFFERAIAADSSYALAQFNRGLIHLKLGHLKEGWEGFEWRWRLPEFTPFQCPQPQWQGEDIADKALLVHSEQGAGDAIQFARFLPKAAKRCRRLIVVCTQNLIKLLETVDGVDQVLPPGTIPGDSFDVFCPIMSLAKVLEIDAHNIPAEIPYLKPPPNLKGVPPIYGGEGLKVGLVWKGSPTHKRDRHRSFELEQWQALLDPAASFYSLQTPLDENETALLKRWGVIPLEPPKPSETHFGRTAHLVQAMDLVIGVDTAVVHLAGALGKPVWIVLDNNPDWRWLIDRDDSPWYPTARLFRQRAGEARADLVARVGEALRAKTDGAP